MPGLDYHEKGLKYVGSQNYHFGKPYGIFLFPDGKFVYGKFNRDSSIDYGYLWRADGTHYEGGLVRSIFPNGKGIEYDDKGDV